MSTLVILQVCNLGIYIYIYIYIYILGFSFSKFLDVLPGFFFCISYFWSIYLGVIILTCGVNSDRRSFARIALYLASDVTEK